jgi:V8-like Glu-specific endopeptidase
MAILCAGSYNASADHFVELSTELPQQDEYVDVIGYPGELNTAWMRTQDRVNDIDESLKEVEKLLPKRTLTVTRGTVKSSGSIVTYNLSTCPGMSGSCVLYKGKVIGTGSSKGILLIIGVHVGQPLSPGSFPSAVSFTGQEVGNLFRQKKIQYLINASA